MSLLVAGTLSPLLGIAAEAKKKRQNKHKKESCCNDRICRGFVCVAP